MIGERELIHDGCSKLKKSIIGTMYDEFEALLHSCHELEGFAWQRKSAFQAEFVVFVTVLEMNSGS